jgi:hypothetical protein
VKRQTKKKKKKKKQTPLKIPNHPPQKNQLCVPPAPTGSTVRPAARFAHGAAALPPRDGGPPSMIVFGGVTDQGPAGDTVWVCECPGLSRFAVGRGGGGAGRRSAGGGSRDTFNSYASGGSSARSISPQHRDGHPDDINGSTGAMSWRPRGHALRAASTSPVATPMRGRDASHSRGNIDDSLVSAGGSPSDSMLAGLIGGLDSLDHKNGNARQPSGNGGIAQSPNGSNNGPHHHHQQQQQQQQDGQYWLDPLLKGDLGDPVGTPRDPEKLAPRQQLHHRLVSPAHARSVDARGNVRRRLDDSTDAHAYGDDNDNDKGNTDQPGGDDDADEDDGSTTEVSDMTGSPGAAFAAAMDLAGNPLESSPDRAVSLAAERRVAQRLALTEAAQRAAVARVAASVAAERRAREAGEKRMRAEVRQWMGGVARRVGGVEEGVEDVRGAWLRGRLINILNLNLNLNFLGFFWF